ncbi:sigma-70 family RNA polymerase sigma factor [Nocardia sp. NBC_00511]|uniref:sigma-70 family RNA polymerase sigma factor n=1 Tax=Nocardia sp. NBC_00511 TaxID=2903591 RepID=UPI0030E201AB
MTTPPPRTATDEVTAQFLEYRELLFAVGYNMLGTVTDTEDVLQEAWLAWAGRHRDPTAAPIDNPRAYLVRLTANQALSRRTEIGRRRETYVGPWLPEPLITEEDSVTGPLERKQSLSTAVLVLLETLSPVERAVFVLHDVFGFPHPEIAEMLDRSPTSIRQLASRARKHLDARRPVRHTDPIPAGLAERLAEATLRGDLPTLLELLAPDVTLLTDSGGLGPAQSLAPVHGRTAVAAIFMAIATQLSNRHVAIHYRRVAEDPCVLIFTEDSPLAAVVIDPTPAGDQIEAVYSVTNPNKLTRIH